MSPWSMTASVSDASAYPGCQRNRLRHLSGLAQLYWSPTSVSLAEHEGQVGFREQLIPCTPWGTTGE